MPDVRYMHDLLPLIDIVKSRLMSYTRIIVGDAGGWESNIGQVVHLLYYHWLFNNCTFTLLKYVCVFNF